MRSDAFIQHMIDRTSGSNPIISVRHALRPDVLWRSYSQQDNELPAMEQELGDIKNNDNNNGRNDTKNKIATEMSRQDPSNRRSLEDTGEPTKSAGVIKPRHKYLTLSRRGYKLVQKMRTHFRLSLLRQRAESNGRRQLNPQLTQVTRAPFWQRLIGQESILAK